MRSSVMIAALLVVALSDPVGAQTFPPTGSPTPPSAVAYQPQPAAAPTPHPAATPTDTSGPAPVYSRLASFTIPFSVTQADGQAMEVLLFVSHDFGANWILYNRQPAAQGQFAFRTNQDGEYWFASRTNPVGTVVSAGASFRPELRVIVDTAQPRLDVQAASSPRGEIQVDWQAVDDLLAPETLKIEYQQAIGQPYRAVQVSPAATQAVRNTAGGRATWMPEPGSYFVSVRIQVSDRAGNTAEVIRRLILPIALTGRPGASAGPAPTAAAAADPSPTAASVPTDPLAAYGMNAGPSASPPPQSPAASEQEVQKPTSPDAPQPIAWPSDVQRAREPGREVSSSAGTRDAASGSKPAEDSPEGPAAASAAEPQGSSASNVPAREVAVSSDAGLVDNASSRSGGSTEPRAGSPESGTNEPANTGELPAGERPRMTSSKRFNLDYSVDAAGPAGVEKIELWVTRNGGRDWDLGWVDEDRESPLLVEVEEEGVYGFRVVIVGKNGLASQTPRPGDLADLWVGVDATQPTAEITSAAYGSDEHAGQLDIRWTASDDHLGSRPVTLSFSAQADGPWTTIAASLPNSGQYFWRVDSRVPDEFYLRLEVRDEAGNVAVHRLDQPLQSAGLTPRGSVRGFKPLGG